MAPFALVLVLLSAVAHATWNLLAKRAGRGATFTWLFDALSVALYAPLTLAALLIERPTLGVTGLVFITGSAVLHLGYFVLLQRGYQVGDLSVVYPLARGLGPLLSTVAAVVYFGERPTHLALTGALLIGVGVVVLTGDPRRLRHGGGRSAGYALVTGVLIAAYTLWDKQAVAVGGAALPPLIYFWGLTTGRALLLTPLALMRWAEVRAGWRTHRREALGIAVLSPLSYLLVLTALRVSPVSYVAPAREIGILLGVLFGTRMLAEGEAARRLGAGAAMVCGGVFLALG
ncbi:MAG TPA: DMT family transporter [Chloroflexota bacterium]|nr:DMT family transporter [Chloroflexota bacterium]